MTSGKSTSYQRSLGGRGRRYGRVSSPAARLITASAPSREIVRMISSSITEVRTIIGHAQVRPLGIALRICPPRSPASRRAYGSWNSASGRSLSIARYRATQRAVSETWVIGVGAGALTRPRKVTSHAAAAPVQHWALPRERGYHAASLRRSDHEGRPPVDPGRPHLARRRAAGAR